MFWGIVAGLISAFLQSSSYICSANFMAKKHSPVQLLIFSQLVMGAACLLALPWCLPLSALHDAPWRFIGWLLVWLVALAAGQIGFFSAQREIEASRLSSLLGLKIIVLALISTIFLAQKLNFWQHIAVIISAAAAVGMNYAGGKRFSLKALGLLVFTLVNYSIADIAETHLVLMPRDGSLMFNAIRVAVTCYALMGVATLPLLRYVRWDAGLFRDAAPFAGAWFSSQVMLFVCFGMLGTVFGNVIQASRGMMSVLMAAVILAMGLAGAEKNATRQEWVRRIAAAALMACGIAIYSLA